MNIGQAKVSTLMAIGELLVVDAHQVEHRGMEIVHVDDIFDRVVADFVGCAEVAAGLDSAAGHPDRERFDVVVAAIALGHWRAPEFAIPHNQRVIEQATLFQRRLLKRLMLGRRVSPCARFPFY